MIKVAGRLLGALKCMDLTEAQELLTSNSGPEIDLISIDFINWIEGGKKHIIGRDPCPDLGVFCHAQLKHTQC